jgi:hypothetical protein
LPDPARRRAAMQTGSRLPPEELHQAGADFRKLLAAGLDRRRLLFRGRRCIARLSVADDGGLHQQRGEELPVWDFRRARGAA